MNNKLVISKKNRPRGDDGYKIFSVRIKEQTVTALEDLSAQTSRSRNELINIILEYGIKQTGCSKWND